MKKPNITADMKVIRRGVDALAEVVDNVIDAILDEAELFGIYHELTEDEQEQLSEFVYDLITQGESEVRF